MHQQRNNSDAFARETEHNRPRRPGAVFNLEPRTQDRMIAFEAQRLDEDARAALHEHFLALSADDRRFRFGTPLSSYAMAAYVDRIDLVQDAVFGVFDARSAIVGAAHVVFEDGKAELGLSVLAGHRRQGAGSTLFRRAVVQARIRGATELFMHFQTTNMSVLYFAQKIGMDIVVHGIESNARLQLPSFSLASVVTEIFRAQPHAMEQPEGG